jgi:hypothetical protein
MSTMFNMFGSGFPMPQSAPQGPLTFAQKMRMVQQAMSNPMMILRQKFPDIPANMTDPNQIYEYLQRTRGVPPQFAQQLMGMFGGNR